MNMQLALKVRTMVGDTFESLGRAISRHPAKVLATSLILLGGFATGLVTATIESRSEFLWTPTESKAYKDWREFDQTFGAQGGKMAMYFRPVDGGNALTYAVIRQALRAHKYTVDHAEASSNGETITWDDVCDKYPDEDDCPISNFLTLWNYDEDTLELMKDFIPTMINGMHQVVNASTFAGGIDFGEDDTTGAETVKEAKVIALIYTLQANVTEDVRAYERAWNAGIEDSVDKSIVEIAHVSPQAISDALANHASRDVPYFIGGIILISCFVLLGLGPLTSCTNARPILGVMTLGVCALAIAAAYGLCSVAGVAMNDFVILLLLPLIGVQAHSVVLLVDSISSADAGDEDVEARFCTALRTSGPPVLVSHVAVAVAFFAGLHTDLPGINALSAYGASSLLFLAVGLFGAVLPMTYFDERRRSSARLAWLPCVTTRPSCAKAASVVRVGAESEKYGSSEDNHDHQDGREGLTAPQVIEHLVGLFVDKLVSPVLLQRPVAAVVVAGFAVVAGLSAAYHDDINIGIAETAAFPADSHVQEVLRLEEPGYFGGRFLLVSVVVDGVDWSSKDDRNDIKDSIDALDDLDFLFYRYPSWSETYEKTYLASKGAVVKNGNFTKKLDDFLHDEGFTKFQNFVSCRDGSCKEPTRVRYDILYSRGSGGVEHTHQRRQEVEAAATSKGSHTAFAYNAYFLATATDDVIRERTLLHVWTATAGVIVIISLVAPAAVAVWTAVCVCMVIADLFGAMIVLGIPYSFVSYACLVMAAGVAVMQPIHFSTTFAEVLDGAQRRADENNQPPADPVDAARRTLATCGVSIFKSSLGVVAALLVMLPVQSVAFRPFYHVVICGVGLGAAHALILMPAMLAMGIPRARRPHSPPSEE